MAIKPQDLQIDLFDIVDELINELDELKLEVGWFASAKYDDDTPVAAVAALNESGFPPLNIPARPFMRPAIHEHTDGWKKLALRLIRQMIKGKFDGAGAMEAMGGIISGQIREKITQVHNPVLKKRTIQRRLRERKDKKTLGLLDKPLVFEGLLLNSLSYWVNDEKEIRPFNRYQAP